MKTWAGVLGILFVVGAISACGPNMAVITENNRRAEAAASKADSDASAAEQAANSAEASAKQASEAASGAEDSARGANDAVSRLEAAFATSVTK
jgi:hypothetical protein